jgi:hypothetical protein
VYGEKRGAWVTEDDVLEPINPKTEARSIAEKDWMALKVGGRDQFKIELLTHGAAGGNELTGACVSLDRYLRTGKKCSRHCPQSKVHKYVAYATILVVKSCADCFMFMWAEEI